MAASTRWKPQSFPAAEVMASPSACSSIWSRRPIWSAFFVTRAAASFWLPAHKGRGFVVPEDECVANTRKGKQVLNVSAPRQSARDRDGGRRTRRVDRRKPQDGDLPTRSGAGNGRAGAACACNAIKMAGFASSRLSRRRRGSRGQTPRGGLSRSAQGTRRLAR